MRFGLAMALWMVLPACEKESQRVIHFTSGVTTTKGQTTVQTLPPPRRQVRIEPGVEAIHDPKTGGVTVRPATP